MKKVKETDFFIHTQIDKHILRLPNGDITLSKRQLLCLIYIMSGMTNKEIAVILKLSPRTIEFYFAILKKKLKVKSKGEMIRLILKTLLQQDQEIIIAY